MVLQLRQYVICRLWRTTPRTSNLLCTSPDRRLMETEQISENVVRPDGAYA
ncbi:hypothetical protein ACFQ3B_12670 [Stackebrandtia endophytica]|uniref:hypothetical protein n=1 Tax=Stackebrandtia endophytica TaxID=1496996 RepID=UPI0014769F12|nr:hypothetical protein [Stackebrandtia endophytica]